MVRNTFMNSFLHFELNYNIFNINLATKSSYPNSFLHFENRGFKVYVFYIIECRYDYDQLKDTNILLYRIFLHLFFLTLFLLMRSIKEEIAVFKPAVII